MSFLQNTASEGFTITPSDTVSLKQTANAIYVGVAGDVALVTAGGSSLTFVGVLAGSILPIKARSVLSTGTTATNLIALTTK
jgi:hypothetical protein